MKRRNFISSSLIPLALPKLSLAGSSSLQATPTIKYFEGRCQKAGNIARSWLGPDNWQAVQSDITPSWNGQLKSKSKDDSLHVAGVTTESFCFCLQRLLQPTHAVSVEITRVDQNLYAWTLLANNKNNRRNS